MGVKHGVYRFSNMLGVQFRLNRAVLAWLGISVLAGIVIAITVVFNPKFTATLISNNLLDTNLPRVIRPTTGLGAILMARIFAFAIIFGLVFALTLHKWTVFLVFPIAGYKGFEIFINLYWTITKFGMATGTVLFVCYFIILLALLVLTLAMMVFCMRFCEPIRLGGFRGGVQWKCFWPPAIKFLVAIVIFAIGEYFIYWLLLSKFVFVV
ncbi:MAG: hypothetical protein LBG88_04205 [Christensenellaceae bacterium]|nr:hypothetical protein [Christensenellaceae bacterium]